MSDAPGLPRLMTAKALAERLALTPAALYAMVERGQIPAVRLGDRSLRFDPSEIATWLDARRIVEGRPRVLGPRAVVGSRSAKRDAIAEGGKR